MLRMAVLGEGRKGAGRELKGLLLNGLAWPRLGLGWDVKDGVSVE